MDEHTNQIEREIAAERRQLDRNLTELEMKAQQLADWRTHYRKHPTVLLGIALSGGFLVGAMARRGRTSHTTNVGPGQAPRPYSHSSRHIENTLFIVSEAVLSLASAKLLAFVGDLASGWSKRSDRSHPSTRDQASSAI